MMKQRSKYYKLTLLILLGITLSNALFAQVKEEKLHTGFYKVIEKGSYKFIEPNSKDTLFLDTLPICSIEDFKKVSLDFDKNGMVLIAIQLRDKGTEKFAKATKENIGKRLAIIANGELLSAPFVYSEIAEGKLSISGAFSVEKAQEIIDKIRKGLPEDKPEIRKE